MNNSQEEEEKYTRGKTKNMWRNTSANSGLDAAAEVPAFAFGKCRATIMV
jgi:hypothetical protein